MRDIVRNLLFEIIDQYNIMNSGGSNYGDATKRLTSIP
jgi:hypothetical protein